MDWIEGRKDLYVKYLDYSRVEIYKLIIDKNNELIHKLYHKKKNQVLDGKPLWLFHGGELINLYSLEKNKVPTKDIDLKLYFTGDYSIPTDIYTKACNKLKKPLLKDFNFYEDTGKKKKEIMKNFSKYLKKYKTTSGLSCHTIWKMGEDQKIDICNSMINNSNKGLYSHLNITNGKIKENIQMTDFMKCSSQKWVNGNKCKAFILNIPYVTQVGRDNFPYDLSDQRLFNLGAQYDEDIDGYHINESILEQINNDLIKWKNDPQLQKKTSREKYCKNILEIIRLRNHKFKLSTVIGVILVYNETYDEWYLFQEGLLDLYIDYSAGHHLSDEKRIYGRYEDGSIPSVLKQVKYGNKNGIIRVPTLTWLIYDQLRMLYVVLRGEYLICNEKKCYWDKLGGGAAGNSEKYFKKLNGLLNSFEGVIRGLQKGNLEQVSEDLQKCKQLDFERCGFQPFLTGLFDNFEFDILKGSSKKRKEKGKRKYKSKRNNKRKTTRKSRYKSSREEIIYKNMGDF